MRVARLERKRPLRLCSRPVLAALDSRALQLTGSAHTLRAGAQR